MVIAVLRLILCDHVDQGAVQDSVDTCRDGRDKIDQRLMEMPSESELFEIHLFNKARHIEPHGNVSEHGRRRHDDDIDQQVILFPDKYEHQRHARQLADCILGDRIFELLHSGKKPGNVEHGGQDPHGQHQIVDPVAGSQGNEDEPDNDAGSRCHDGHQLDLPEENAPSGDIIPHPCDLPGAVCGGTQGGKHRKISLYGGREVVYSALIRSQDSRDIGGRDQGQNDQQELIYCADRNILFKTGFRIQFVSSFLCDRFRSYGFSSYVCSI